MKVPELLDSPAALTADLVFMDRAMEMAERAVGLASPNPMVGAVVVRGRRIVGEGTHLYDAQDHAEIVALRAARASARGATLYVNLEPCCTTGRTGPCTKAIIAAGIVRVVAAMSDPNPSVAGKGFAELRAAGIEVVSGVRGEEARIFNEAFARWIVTGLPLITLKSGMTLDGQLSLSAKNGHKPGTPGECFKSERWITSPESREEVQRMRHGSDAVLTGIGTVLADDPVLTDRTGLRRRRKLLRVVMDSRLRLPVHSKMVQSADGDVLVFTRTNVDSPKAQTLRRAGVEVIRLPGRGAKTDLGSVAAELGRRELLGVLLEAGPVLNAAALTAGIVDKMSVFVAPILGGASGAPLIGGALRAVQTLQNTTVIPFGPDFAIEGYLRDVYGTR
jgi:diaminohydroxyphosphoribosylaminopyrimidine deaminase/5-amino-6-(5-phosphoribosylamino)uracil reductase